ncbi:MAG TPA: glycosyltransferase family 4 protein [Bacteroidales bacterium]|nr:glycosyltransferase family 4 protein [Bacteroidales bacterium]
MDSRRLHILFISSWYPNRVKPTLGNFVQKHAEAVSAFAGVSVLHVCYDESLKKSREVITEQTSENTLTIYIYLRKRRNVFLRFYSYLKAYKDGLNLVKEKYRTPDVIHANVLLPVGMVFYFLKCFRNIPHVFTEHWAGYLPEYPQKLPWYKKYVLKKIIKNADGIIPVTENLKNAMTALNFKGKYFIVPNVVDTRIFVPGTGEHTSRKKILHVSSSDDDQKNISGTLTAVKILSELRQDFELHLVIDGGVDPFAQRAEQLGLLNSFVFFYGTQKTTAVAEMMQQSDFLLLFSNYENFPCVIAEAMSCGLPVLTTCVGGIAEHVGGGNGILIEAGDQAALVAQLVRILDTCRSYDKAGIRAYAEKHFSYEVVGKQFLEIYKQVLCS